MGIEDRAHYVVERWMISELGLSGNRLALYAIIFGFSMAGNQEYTASINYFCDWLGASRPTVIGLLKDLESKGLITKSSKEIKGIIYNSYRAVIPQAQSSEDPQPQKVEKPDKKDGKIPFTEIVSYLNERVGSSFRASSETTRNHIRARWNEGFRLDDFKLVVEVKVKEWKYDKKMASYLRPKTLFGTKFESYLQQAKRENVSIYIQSQEQGPEAIPAVDENGKELVY